VEHAGLLPSSIKWPTMLTRRIDAAFDAIIQCRRRLPFLSEMYRPDTPERVAIDELLNALQRADEALLRRARRRR
jgi:hypothetical protein